MTFLDRRRLVPWLVLGLVLGAATSLVTGTQPLMSAWLGCSFGVVVAYVLDATRGPVRSRER